MNWLARLLPRSWSRGDEGGGEKTSDLVESEYEGDAILQPVPLGAPLPPYDEEPHAVIAPDASSAAKA